MRVGPALAPLLLAACGRPVAYLEPPPFQRAQTVVAAVDGAALQLAPTGQLELALLARTDAEHEVVAAGLLREAAELGLAPGPWPPDQDGAPLSGLAREGVLRARYVDGGWGPWEPLAALPSPLAEARLPRGRCPRAINRREVELDLAPPAFLALPRGDEEALLLAESGAQSWRRGQAPQAAVALPVILGGAVQAPEGPVLVAHGGGPALFTLDPSTLELTLSSSSADGALGVLAALDARAGQVFAVSNTGRVIRAVGPSLELLGAIDVAGSRTDEARARIVGPNEVLLGADNNPDLLRYDGASITRVLAGPLDSTGFVVIDELAGLGLVAIEQYTGQVYLQRAGRWEERGRALEYARVLHAAQGRVFLADRAGGWAELQLDATDACAARQESDLGEIQVFFRLGAVLYGAGPVPGDRVGISALARLD